MTDEARRIEVNGRPRITQARRVADLIGELADELGIREGGTGVAVAVNQELVPRSTWSDHRVEDGDRVDIVGAVQGG